VKVQRDSSRITYMHRKTVKGTKGKAIPVTGRGGPYGSETSRLPQFLDNRLTDGGEFVSLTHRPRFTPRKIAGTHFCYRMSRLPAYSALHYITLHFIAFHGYKVGQNDCGMWNMSYKYKTYVQTQWRNQEHTVTTHKAI
jgi:hypothetical protein